MNKKIIGIFLLILLGSFGWENNEATAYPNSKVQQDLIIKIGLFNREVESYLKLLETGNESAFVKQYEITRKAYKGIETYVMFRYPSLDKAINGGPVPSITKEVVILHKDDPSGLQVIEELLVEEDVNKNKLLIQLKLLKKNALQVETSITNLPFQNWEILEANHLAITKLITLSLSGFDSPVYLLSIQDAIVVLTQIKDDLSYYNDFVNPSFNSKSFEAHLTKCISFLSNSTFESLNRYQYYKDYLLPLQAQIKKMHLNTGYETYNEVSSIKRSIGNGEHLFSKNYLDPYYSVRGNVTTHNQEQIELGKVLFFDPILSKNNKRACASCHSPAKAFADGLSTSLAFDFKGNLQRNSPTLINSCFQNNFFWDLRSSNMNDQIMSVILSKEEFNTTPEEIVSKLKQSEDYKTLFDKAFYSHQQPISIGTVKASIEMYVRTLVSLDSKFDKNMNQEETTFSEEEIKGANLFLGKAACATCHFPPNFNGFVPPHFTETEGEILGTTSHPESTQLDQDFGVYERFKNSYPQAEYIKGMFKTPTLRNIEFTAPYMHNGMFSTLEEVILFYNHGGGAGVGIDIPQQTLASDSLFLSVDDQKSLIAFLKTLSDTSSFNVEPFDLPVFTTDSLNNRTWGGEY
jgi:cytochrome c peroxidase